jgi:hypothetical protein
MCAGAPWRAEAQKMAETVPGRVAFAPRLPPALRATPFLSQVWERKGVRGQRGRSHRANSNGLAPWVRPWGGATLIKTLKV